MDPRVQNGPLLVWMRRWILRAIARTMRSYVVRSSESKGRRDFGRLGARAIQALSVVVASSCADVAPQNTEPDPPGKKDGPDSSVPVDGAVSAMDASQTDAGPNFILPAEVACAPKGNACSLPAADARVFSSFRRDFYLPSAKYDERNPDPTAGGRFQIAGISTVSGAVTSVTFDGVDAETLLVEPKLEWYQVWPRTLVAGEPVWVSFHSRDPKWNSGGTARVVVKTAGGDALGASVKADPSDVALTYVTTDESHGRLIVHARNTGAAPKTLSRLLVNGRDVLASDVACAARRTLPPNSSAYFEVPQCTKLKDGAPWTVVAELDGGGTAVGVGRVIRPFFPIEAWHVGSDCPTPMGFGGKADTFTKHSAAGFDTYYYYAGGSSGDGCAVDTMRLVNDLAPPRTDIRTLMGDDFLSRTGWETALRDTRAVVGFLLGDEVDDKIYDAGKALPAIRAANSRKLWERYPDIPTYIGSKTNRYVGSFSGAADIQGSDFYVAACAPHITSFGKHPPIDGAYDYLRNTRDNHMPNTTWFYAQGLHGGWNKKVPVINTEIVSQPDPQEILVQGFSVFAAGGKGMMWFQTSMAEAVREPKRWQAVGYVNSVARGVRSFLREGDIVGGVRTTGSAIVEAIRSRDAIVVPVIGIKATKAPEDLECQQALIGLGPVPHWQLGAQTLDVVVEVPPDFQVADVFEVTDTSTLPVVPVVTGRSLVLKDRQLDNTMPARMYVLARNPEVRGSIAAALQK